MANFTENIVAKTSSSKAGDNTILKGNVLLGVGT